MVIVQQPTTATTPLVERSPSQPEYGMFALVFAIVSTVIMAVCGCWWALPCTAVGIVLGITVSWCTAALYCEYNIMISAKNLFVL